MHGLPSGWTDVLKLAELEFRTRETPRRGVFGGGLSSLPTTKIANRDIVHRFGVLDRTDTLAESAALDPLPTRLVEDGAGGWSDDEPPPLPTDALDHDGVLDGPVVSGLTAALDTLGLVELLQLLERGRCSGTIYIEAPEGCGSIEVQDGHVSAAGVDREPAEGEPFELTTLPGDAAAGAAHHIIEAVRQMAPWCDGLLQYTPHERTAPRVDHALPIQRLLMAALMD